MARITSSELNDPARFRRLLTIEHTNILPFVQEYYLVRRNRVVWVHYLLSLLCLLGVFWAGISAGASSTAWFKALAWAGLCFILLIPIHEGIHGLVYLAQGARDVRFGGSLRILAFYAVAHDFVVGPGEFACLALAPFLVINGVCLALALASPALRLFALILSLLHLSAVSGDWAMLGFLWEHRAAPVYTFDDADGHISYFYQANTSS